MGCSKRLVIPTYAKKKAKKALLLRKKLTKTKKFGLSIKQAQNLGIKSGIQQAMFLIKKRTLSYGQTMPYYRFYQRFKNCRTKKCEMAMDLWGGRKFLKTRVFSFIKRNGSKRSHEGARR